MGRVWPRHGYRGRPLNPVVRRRPTHVESVCSSRSFNAAGRRAMKRFLGTLLVLVFSPSTSGQSLRPFEAPNPCRLPPQIQEKDLAKYALRWIVINPSGCAQSDMPPPNVRVLLYYPTRWDGKRYGVSVFGYWSSGRAWFADGGMGGSPSHWMYVSEPLARRSSGSLFRDGKW